MWGYAIGTAVVVYFGYRYLKNRSGSSSNSSNATNSGSADSPSDPGSIDSGVPPDTSTTGNTTPGDRVTTDPGIAPPAGDSTGIINGPVIGEHKPKDHKHKGMHDHKQGMHHTKRRKIHRRKPGHKQTKYAHAPRVNKNPHSRVKNQTVKNIPPATALAFSGRGGRVKATPVPVTAETRIKELPAPIAVHPHEVKHPKQPPRKRRRVA